MKNYIKIQSISCLLFLICEIAVAQVRVDSLIKITNPEFAYPHWSPDGKQIVYQSNVTGSWDIYKMNADGSTIQRLTNDESDNMQPSWSPDGSTIAFVSNRDGDNEIFVMDTLGGNLQQLTNNEQRDIHPYWSPDSKQIVYNTSGDDNKLIIQSLDLNSRAVETLLEDEWVNSYASYSPDGTKIAYVKWLEDGKNGEIYCMDLQTGEENRLTNTMAFDGYPAWAHDGKKIIYASVVDAKFKLFVINSDGTERQQLTSGGGMDSRPNWSKDGRKIVFNRQIDGSIEVYVIRVGL